MKAVRRSVAIACLAAPLLSAASASAHIELINPPPRYVFEPPSGENQKTGPCATGTPSGVVTTYAPGQTITVTFDEVVNHPGHFRIALDLTGQDDYADPDSENDLEIKDNIIAYVDDDGSSSFAHTFALPNVECDPCSIQVMQVMTDKLPWGPENGDDIYYWCSDIVIEEGAVTGQGGAGGSTSSGPTGSGGMGGSVPGLGSGEGGGEFTPGTSNGSGDLPADDGGCACRTGAPTVRPVGGTIPGLLLALGGVFAWRLSRRRPV